MAPNRIEPPVLYRLPRVTFRFSEDVHRLVLRVVDVETGDVIKELPPEDELRATALRREAIARFIDKKL